MPEPKHRSSLRTALKKKRAREVWVAIALGILISGALAALLWFLSQLGHQH